MIPLSHLTQWETALALNLRLNLCEPLESSAVGEFAAGFRMLPIEPDQLA